MQESLSWLVEAVKKEIAKDSFDISITNHIEGYQVLISKTYKTKRDLMAGLPSLVNDLRLSEENKVKVIKAREIVEDAISKIKAL